MGQELGNGTAGWGFLRFLAEMTHRTVGDAIVGGQEYLGLEDSIPTDLLHSCDQNLGWNGGGQS